jgi:hypothetical protein
MPSCVYCGAEADAREHWLPRALGTFGPLQVPHDTICEECNRALGREVDEAFIRTGPEAILRIGLGIEGRRGRGSNPFYNRAATTQPLRAINVPGDDEAEPELLWETYRGEDGQPHGRLMQQLVVVDSSGTRHLIPFNPEWTAEVLRVALTHRNITGATLHEIYLDQHHVERVKPVLRDVFPGFRAELFGRDGAGQKVRRIGFENTIGPDYFRGLAKIALHGALRLVPELDGHASEFESLRRFIRHAEPPADRAIWRRQDALVQGLGNGEMLRDWGHIIGINADESQLCVLLQFFIGPGALPPPWVIRLGSRPVGMPQDFAVGYYARYLEQPAPDGCTGEFVRLDAVRLPA